MKGLGSEVEAAEISTESKSSQAEGAAETNCSFEKRRGFTADN